MAKSKLIPDGDWISSDAYNKDGTVVVYTFPRSTAEMFVALYGAPLRPFRAATAQEISARQAEDDRIAKLYGGAS